MRFYDSHNHLQDPRLPEESVRTALALPDVAAWVVNGTEEKDWPSALNLARLSPKVIPMFGLHPWRVAERSPAWEEKLLAHLNELPSGVGEIGLDRWIRGHQPKVQEEIFVTQLRLAAERNLPVTIHCLRAWGRLLQLLQSEPRPARGFLLHSYGGPIEMVSSFASLGAYFSFSGYFARERKLRQREVFRAIPRDRLLIETDAPDMLPPDSLIRFPLRDERNNALNHPGNIESIYTYAAEWLREPVEELAARIERNFQFLFA